MNCPEHLVLKALGSRLFIYLWWRDVPRELIPLRVWLNPLRYQVSFCWGENHVTINNAGKWNTALSNWIYCNVRPQLCRFGIHQHFSFRGGEKLCHHCKLGTDNVDGGE